MRYPTALRGEQAGGTYDKTLGERRAGKKKVLGGVFPVFREKDTGRGGGHGAGQMRRERQNWSRRLALSCPSPCVSRRQRRGDMGWGDAPLTHRKGSLVATWRVRPTMFQFEKAELCGRLGRREGSGKEVARPLSRSAGVWGLSVGV